MSEEKHRDLPICACGHKIIIFRIQPKRNSPHLVIRIGANTEKEALELFAKYVKDPKEWTRCIELEDELYKEQARLKLFSDGTGPSMFT